MPVDTKGYSALQNDDDIFQLDHDAGCWIQDGSIHMKVVTGYGDPVELTADEARLLAAALKAIADRLDVLDGNVPP